MDKKRKWQLALILSVIGLTLYNILPTLFYYSKPLTAPVSEEQATQIGREISKRVDDLETQSLSWLRSYSELLGVKPLSISTSNDSAGQITLLFSKSEDAAKFKKFLPRAGSLIPFFPAQLGVATDTQNPKEVVVQRRISVRLSELNPQALFTYIPKYEDGTLSTPYKNCASERLEAVLSSLRSNKIFSFHPAQGSDSLLSVATSIQSVAKLYDVEQEIAVRYAQFQSVEGGADALIGAFDQLRDLLKKEKGKEEITPELIRQIEIQETKLATAESFVKKHPALFNPKKESPHPFFQQISIHWDSDQIQLKLFPDVAAALKSPKSKQRIEQLLIDEVAKIGHETNESISPSNEGYAISLMSRENGTGFLSLNLSQIAKKEMEGLLHAIQTEWKPTHHDLSKLQIVSAEEYLSLPAQSQALCLVLSAPIAEKSPLAPSLKNNSLYVIAKGVGHLLKTYEQAENTDAAKLFLEDFRALGQILSRNGFVGYSTSLFGSNQQEIVFEQRNFYAPLIQSSRENFVLLGSKKRALLELSNFEDRLLTLNRIETEIHEELIKVTDEYKTASVSLNPLLRFDVPKPEQSILWSNMKLSARKFFRGDDRKILRWGLDLSGGKTVQIELRDKNNAPVKGESDLKQGINELFNRVNKMGVSDVSIRQVGHHIVLDFPGGQALSAAELVKASSMYFHVVNEKFGPANRSLADTTNRFLQEVWNEAVVQNRKDPESIQRIAYRHLHGEEEGALPSTDAAKVLFEEGLRLAKPQEYTASQEVNDSVSKIVILRGADSSEWHGQTHPLMIVFQNHALEGSQLDQIRGNYDPSKGNFLSFEVKGSAARSNLYAWTSQFSKEKVIGTERELASYGKGWRMAVLLNDTVISSPTLESALRDSASISGSFTQREINQLVSDLKAGSLTFTPHILSEKNVSPELGKNDRMQGITATIVALLLIIGSMIAYYRFAGWIASIAVLFNLAILWAVLQNLGASLSLASIAGIILTVGMAVDANVLVFERMKEEFALSGRIASAIQVGYEKAFSAIIDSNITTIIAALILLNFDAGPIKSFAVSMIIGIASSMFTALFMTRFFFDGWVQNPKNKMLTMANWIRASNFNFLKHSKSAFAIAATVIVIGGGLLFQYRSTIFGMDFTGGYALHLEVEKRGEEEPARSVEMALLSAGATTRDFQIRQHNPATQLRILFGTTMEQPGKPFYGMPIEIDLKEGNGYQKNPRIDWIVKTLAKENIQITNHSLNSLESNWTAMSGQMSESMRNNALIGLLIAFVSIFVYIAFRFEYKYASSAILCLLHDVLITIGVMALFHALGAPVQIDLNTIAALMTIIGYSLNDTIIIFDRIREDVQLHPKLSMTTIVNHALNSTLSRTAITSGTTLFVLLALLFLGGSSMFSFSLVMVVGVIFGTLSSWFIASPLLLFFHKKEEKEEEWVRTNS